MADKKITQLTPAGAISANDILGICQNPATGELLQTTAGDLRSYVLGGANAGARVYFNVGAPSVAQGVDGDVAFDVQGHAIYQKISGVWELQDTYGTIGGVDRIRFTAVYGSGGLSADGKVYTSTDLVDVNPTSVKIEADDLIAVAEWGDPPAFDEFDYDIVAGQILFGSAVPAGARVTIIYGF